MLRALVLLLFVSSCGLGLPGEADGVGRVVRGVAADGGSAVDAGSTGGTGSDGGVSSAGGFCVSCVSSADCEPGALCVGGTEPRCAVSCAATLRCEQGATCERIGFGKGPLLGTVCQPGVSACGSFVRRTDLTCADSWATYAASFLSSTCTSCHRHQGQWSTLAEVRHSADAIRLTVETGAMPAGVTLSAAERLRLLTWFACGAP